MKLTWHLKKFNQLDLKTLWQIYYLRDQVFVVEQNSPYQEVDQQDQHSYHLYALDNQNQLVAYARFFKNQPWISFGRVVIPKKYRGKGLGKDLVNHLLKDIHQIYGKSRIVIEAQYYAINFYKKFGFRTSGQPFMDALRKHIKMIKD